jgi:hypothetical protein
MVECRGPRSRRGRDEDRFPTLSVEQLSSAWVPPDDENPYFLTEALNSFEFGLTRVLDGIEAFIQQRNHADPDR